jgi:hypothetical protein
MSDYKTLIAGAREYGDALQGSEHRNWINLVEHANSLADAVEALQAERDEALKALGESRQRFADSETRRAELEAALDAVRKLATGPTPTVDEWWPMLRSIAAAASAVPSVVLQDRDAAVWDQGFVASENHKGHVAMEGTPWKVTHPANPYRADQDGEQS